MFWIDRVALSAADCLRTDNLGVGRRQVEQGRDRQTEKPSSWSRIQSTMRTTPVGFSKASTVSSAARSICTRGSAGT